MVVWHGKGLTLKEAAEENSLCGQLNRLGLDIDAGRKSGLRPTKEVNPGERPSTLTAAEEAERRATLTEEQRRAEDDADDGDTRDEKQGRDKRQKMKGNEGDKRKGTLDDVFGDKKRAASSGSGPPGDDDDDDDDETPADSGVPGEDVGDDDSDRGALLDIVKSDGKPDGPSEMSPEDAKQMRTEDDMLELIEQREFLLRSTRTQFETDEFKADDKYQKTFSPEAVYVSLLTQQNFVTQVSEGARADRVKLDDLGQVKSTKKSPVVPPSKIKMVEGVPMVVVQRAKHDYELSVSTNYCISKRLLNPRELAPIDEGDEEPEDKLEMDTQKLHSTVKLGFCVYASETDKFEAGGKIGFRGGEGTCDVLPNLTGEADLRKHRRRHLYRYQTKEPSDYGLTAEDGQDDDIPIERRAHWLELSSKLLEFQPRSLGFPLFETPFKQKASLDDVRLDESGLPDLSDPKNAKVYHHAMRYRFEVVRLWWKLFHHQQDDVYGFIKFLSLQQEDASTFFTDGNFAGTEKFVDAIVDTTRPPMVLAVTELGKTGMLEPGSIYPKYKENPYEYDKDTNRNLFKLFDDPEDPNPSRVKDESERMFTEPVQLYGSDTWPIVKIGMNGSWLDWVGVKRGINRRNNQAFGIMESIFGGDGRDPAKNIAVDYDEIFANPTKEMTEHVFRNYGMVFEDPRVRQAQFWYTFSVLAGDMMESMPLWANAYLCDELVAHTPEHDQAVASKLAILKNQLSKRDADLDAKVGQLNIMIPTNKIEKEAKEYQEKVVYFSRVKRAAKLEQIKELEFRGSASHVIWRPYSSNMQEERLADDAKSPQSKTWAQECLHRSTLGVYNSDWQFQYYTVDRGLTGQPQRSYDGMPFSLMEGEGASADFFRQWYDEVYRDLGDDGLALPGHLVIMNNLVNEGNPTLKDMPGTVQLQGHVARVMSRTRRYGPRPNTDQPEGPQNLPVALFPPFSYLLETQFDTNVSSAAALVQAKKNKEVSTANKIMVKLTDQHIMPFSYRSPYRYGDSVELRRIDPGDADDKVKKKYYKTFGYEEGRSYQQRWIIADVPFIGPPSVLSAERVLGGLGWGRINADEPTNSYPFAPAEHKGVVATLGSLVLTKHQPRVYTTMQKDEALNVKDYMRWPISEVFVQGKMFMPLFPLDELIEGDQIPAEIKEMDVYRQGNDGKRLRFSSYTLFKWEALPHQEPEKEKDVAPQYDAGGGAFASC